MRTGFAQPRINQPHEAFGLVYVVDLGEQTFIGVLSRLGAGGFASRRCAPTPACPDHAAVQ